jgi:hypothetical protein
MSTREETNGAKCEKMNGAKCEKKELDMKFLKLETKHWVVYVSSVVSMVLTLIYSATIFFQISKDITGKTEGVAVVGFVIAFYVMVGLFAMQKAYLKAESYYYSKMRENLICVFFTTLVFSYGPICYAYYKSYKYLSEDTILETHKHENLKNNMIASNVLHAIAFLFNFFAIIVIRFWARKSRTVTITIPEPTIV